MDRRLINIGIKSSSLLIFIQLIAGFIELSHHDNKVTETTVNMLNIILNITLFTILWRVLVKYYGQKQFDWLLKSMIILLITISLLSIIILIKISTIILIIIVGMSFISLILSFVFLSRIMDIEKFEIKRIEYLKNYSLSFLLCMISQFVLTAFIELKKINLKFINHLLLLIPILFILIFFNKIKADLTEHAST